MRVWVTEPVVMCIGGMHISTSTMSFWKEMGVPGMWFDKITTWSDDVLKAMFEQANRTKRMGCQSGLDVRVYDDLLEEMQRRNLPQPCPVCGSTAISVVTAGDAKFHCNQCGKKYG